mmetsp:Transcript_4503/g.9627  ORF Transcript_4503/g.9627 Transcript_4503/m.9627 type:complete len:358 (-) Transcript_4503:65-1138(-)
MGFFYKATVVASIVVVLSIMFQLHIDGKIRTVYPTPEWSLDDIPNLEGQIAVITGANSGLGYATALELLKKGATVVLGTRAHAKAIATQKRLQQEPGVPAKYFDNIVVPENALDLSSLQQVQKFSEEYLSTYNKLDMLFLNAASIPMKFETTEDGYEMQLGVDHIAHYSLTLRLLPALEASGAARVVVVSSTGHKFAQGLHLENHNDPTNYDYMVWYGRAKLANMLFARSLSRRVLDKGIYVNSCHPGLVATEIFQALGDVLSNYLSENVVSAIGSLVANTLCLSPAEGATTQLHLGMPLIAQQNITNKYYMPTARVHDANPYALNGGPSKESMDDELAEELWAWTAKETGLDIPLH